MMTKNLYVLNEITVIPIFFRILLGQRPLLLFPNPLLKIFAGVLKRLDSWLHRRRYVGSLDDLGPNLPWYPEFPLDRPLVVSVYPEVEEDVHAACNFENLGASLGKFKYGFRKCVSGYTFKIIDLFLVIDWAENNLPGHTWKLRGAPRHVDLIAKSYTGENHHYSSSQTFRFYFFFNFLNTLAIAIAGCVWLIARTRISPPERSHYRLAADRISLIDHYLFQQVIDDPAELLIVDRSAAIKNSFADNPLPYCSVLVSDARISILQSARIIWRFLRDIFSLFLRLSDMEPAIFSDCAVFLAKTARYTAFFERYRPEYFWGRDDYSTEHIARNMELRKIGGKSLGINHGLPFNTVLAPWREIDFDIYYVFGVHLHRTYYGAVWPRHMKVKAVGALNMKREYRKRLTANRSKDIVFLPMMHRHFEENMHAVFRVAEHFQDRLVYIKMKASRRADQVAHYKTLMCDAPINVVAYIDPIPYELLLNVTYALGSSTPVAEAIQFRVVSFAFDTDSEIKHLYWRDFPGLTVSGAEDIIRRIENIESGKESYDFQAFNELIRVDGPDIFDVIREDIGLQRGNGTR